MKTNEKNQLMKANLKLIKKLINKVIDYNLKTGAHIFIDYAPHCEQIQFRVYDNPDKKWGEGGTVAEVGMYYDWSTEEVQEEINKVEKWML